MATRNKLGSPEGGGEAETQTRVDRRRAESSRGSQDIFGIWIEGLQHCYALARGERLNEMNGTRQRFLDARGIHPFSAAWGAVQAAEALEPMLGQEGIATTAHALTTAAREDAEQTYRAEIAAELQAVTV